MSNKKIGCGGFIIDGETLQEKDGVLSVIGGGGSGGGAFVTQIEMDGNIGVLDHTWQEIHDAPMPKYATNSGLYFPIYFEGNVDSKYVVLMFSFDNASPMRFETNSADGYPSFGDK